MNTFDLHSVCSRMSEKSSSTKWCDVIDEEPELCDTCSGEGDSDDTDDDTVSLCSWITDQGDWDSPVVLHQPREELTCLGFVPVFMPVAPSWQMNQHHSSSMECQPAGDQLHPSVPSKTPPELKQEESTRVASPTCMEEANDGDSTKTTLVFQNCPKGFGRDEIAKFLDSENFRGLYNFIHVPREFHTNEPVGYAVVNFVSTKAATSAMKHFQNSDRWLAGRRSEALEVTWNKPLQGYAAHVERYRNSPLMHQTVPESYRPLIFRNGKRVTFPKPTTRVRAPRVRSNRATF